MSYEPCGWHKPIWDIHCADCCVVAVIEVTATDAEGRRVL